MSERVQHDPMSEIVLDATQSVIGTFGTAVMRHAVARTSCSAYLFFREQLAIGFDDVIGYPRLQKSRSNLPVS
jgi:hypothetical protein